MINKLRINKLEQIQGFTLFEILISMLVVGGILTIMFSGFSVSNNLLNQSVFESEASLLAERELEYLKTEMLNTLLPTTRTLLNSKFPINAPWKISSIIEPDALTNCYRIFVKVEKQQDSFALESYIYTPKGELSNEG